MKAKELNKIEIKLPALSQNESLARQIICSFASQLDPTTSEISDLRVIISEAVTNCIVHAYKSGYGIITLRATSYSDRSVKITVSDNGCGIEDVAQARRPLFTTLPGEDRCGMGFSIMESFSDKLSVVSAVGKGTKVTMIRTLGDRT